ncbi:MAG: carboxypeptidase-like regulatory domain-containing protein [Bacteroidia bacterium]|nr:carboxypeptidase-like regulatory domain-containing protein [Bacteroidia bacterium]
MKRLFQLFLILISVSASGQIIIKGKVADISTKEPIPFASIGIKGKAYGTVCDENGVFELKVGAFTETDTLKITAIGYDGKKISMKVAKNFSNETIYLPSASVQLSEVKVKPKKTITKVLGNKNYNTGICLSFTGAEGNYKGAEISIKANNKKGRLVFLENFNFYIVKNLYKDSLTFRLNFYKEDKNGLPGENILRKPIIFKTMVKEGVVSVNLKHLFINTDDDFFMSLECLEDEIDKEKLCFSGSVSGPCYMKAATFMDWMKIPFGGIDFNVTVTYQK